MQETVIKLSRSFTVPIRGLGYHVRTWGEADAPTLFMLHGWMDVGASFQFLVDALRVVDSDEITLELSAPNRPGLLKGGPDFVYVIMPVNLT